MPAAARLLFWLLKRWLFSPCRGSGCMPVAARTSLYIHFQLIFLLCRGSGFIPAAAAVGSLYVHFSLFFRDCRGSALWSVAARCLLTCDFYAQFHPVSNSVPSFPFAVSLAFLSYFTSLNTYNPIKHPLVIQNIYNYPRNSWYWLNASIYQPDTN